MERGGVPTWTVSSALSNSQQLENGQTYYVHVYACDGLLNCVMHYSEPVICDTTPPVVPEYTERSTTRTGEQCSNDLYMGCTPFWPSRSHVVFSWPITDPESGPCTFEWRIFAYSEEAVEHAALTDLPSPAAHVVRHDGAVGQQQPRRRRWWQRLIDGITGDSTGTGASTPPVDSSSPDAHESTPPLFVGTTSVQVPPPAGSPRRSRQPNVPAARAGSHPPSLTPPAAYHPNTDAALRRRRGARRA